MEQGLEPESRTLQHLDRRSSIKPGTPAVEGFVERTGANSLVVASLGGESSRWTRVGNTKREQNRWRRRTRLPESRYLPASNPPPSSWPVCASPYPLTSAACPNSLTYGAP